MQKHADIIDGNLLCRHCACVVQDSRGNTHVRAEVAKFIEDRDGVGPADPNVSHWVEEPPEWDRGNRARGKRTATATQAAEHRVPGGQQRST